MKNRYIDQWEMVENAKINLSLCEQLIFNKENHEGKKGRLFSLTNVLQPDPEVQIHNISCLGGRGRGLRVQDHPEQFSGTLSQNKKEVG